MCRIFFRILLVPHQPVRLTPMTETVGRFRQPFIIRFAVSKEAGFSMVRNSPSVSWVRGASITPSGAKEPQRSRSTFLRVLFLGFPTLAAAEGERNGSHA